MTFDRKAAIKCCQTRTFEPQKRVTRIELPFSHFSGLSDVGCKSAPVTRRFEQELWR